MECGGSHSAISQPNVTDNMKRVPKYRIHHTCTLSHQDIPVDLRINPNHSHPCPRSSHAHPAWSHPYS